MPKPAPSAQATREDVVRLFGMIDDEDVVAILSLAPTLAEVEEAQAWLEGQGDALAREGRPQTARTAAILEIVDRNEDDDPSGAR